MSQVLRTAHRDGAAYVLEVKEKDGSLTYYVYGVYGNRPEACNSLETAKDFIQKHKKTK